MAAIDLVVLGMLKREPLSAYDIQKLIEYRKISEWVKISTPSIYKKVIQLADKGLINSKTVKGENLADKVVYSLTKAGENAFRSLMEQISESPIHFFLDFNAVMVNIDSLPKEEQKNCLDKIEKNILIMKMQMEDNMEAKKSDKSIPRSGFAVLQQQYMLVQSMEEWIASVRIPAVD